MAGQEQNQKIRDLWAAVLKQAVDDLRPTGRAKESNTRIYWRRQAEDWFMSSRTDNQSFLSVCGYLDLDPEIVRSMVLPPTREAAA